MQSVLVQHDTADRTLRVLCYLHSVRLTTPPRLLLYLLSINSNHDHDVGHCDCENRIMIVMRGIVTMKVGSRS